MKKIFIVVIFGLILCGNVFANGKILKSGFITKSASVNEGMNINDPKNKRQSAKHFKKQYMATPLKRQVDVEQICNAVDFFIKNRSITGQVISIDSGQSLNWQTPDIMGSKE